MLHSTKNAINDTFDFIKRLIYIFQIFVQIIYIGYGIFRFVNHMGNLAGNIILLTVSIFYILYYIITTKEFYTNKQVQQKKIVKWIVKISKYAVNIYIIILAVIPLVSGTPDNENAMMLMTITMIIGILLSIVFDGLLLMVNKQIELVKSAMLYDIEHFKVNHEFETIAIKKIGLDLEKEFPKFKDKNAIKKVKKMNARQEKKQMRKRDFKRIKKT